MGFWDMGYIEYLGGYYPIVSNSSDNRIYDVYIYAFIYYYLLYLYIESPILVLEYYSWG